MHRSGKLVSTVILIHTTLLGCGERTDGTTPRDELAEEVSASTDTEGAHSVEPPGGAVTRDAEQGSEASDHRDVESVGGNNEPSQPPDEPPLKPATPGEASQEGPESAETGEEEVSNPASDAGVSLTHTDGRGKEEETALVETELKPSSASDASIESASNVPPSAPSIELVFDEVFEPAGCTAGYCHGGGAGELTFDDPTVGYQALVGQDAAEPVCGLTQLVVPGEPESSILWLRVRPEPEDATDEPCATKMPKTGGQLDTEQAQLVRDWIAGGALP